jgi:signal peptidase II
MVSEGASSRSLGPPMVLGAVALVVVTVDQLTKALVVASLPVGGRVEVLGDFVVLWHVQNTGAAFSLFEGMTLLFYAITALALVMIAYFHISFRERSLWLHALLGLVLGGSLGNLIDRVRLGAVTDFVSVGVGDLRWPTFNVADSSLVVGILLLVGYLVLLEHPRQPTRTPPA